MITRPLLLLALLAGGCGPSRTLTGALWDPESAVAVGDQLFVHLPHAGEVVRLGIDGEPVRLDPQPARYTALIPSPDAHTLLARTVEDRCANADCEESIEVASLQVLAPDGLATTTFEVGAWYTSFAFSDDDRFVVALQDPAASTVGGGVVNLASVYVIDLVAGTSWEVSVGFEARRVLFLGHGEGGTTGMLVLSQNEVAVVDLSAEVPVPGAVFPLTLDADVTVAPIGVATTPDDASALITVEKSSDLYVLDLVDPSINLVSLAGVPSAMAVDAAHDQTLFVYGKSSVVEVLDHRLFDIRQVDLDEVATEIWVGADYAVLSDPHGGQDVVRLDLADLHTDTYRLNWTPGTLALSPDGSFAVSLAEEASQGRLEVIDLRADSDGDVDVRPKPFGLSGAPLDVAFTATADGTSALLLQQGVETLFELRWPSLDVGEVELPAAPVAIGELGDAFWITLADDLGLVSFYRPGEALVTKGDFAGFGLLDDRHPSPVLEE